MNREYYTEVLDEMKRAQGKLSHALYSDLDRLAGAESNSTKAKVQEAYERGVNEAFQAFNALYDMHPLDLQIFLEGNGLDDITQVVETENNVEMLKRIQQAVRVIKVEKPQIGDEVTYRSPMKEITGIVIEKSQTNAVKIFDPIGIGTYIIQEENVTKTGRHCTDVEKFLDMIKAMRGD